jgi:hypothetical protein
MFVDVDFPNLFTNDNFTSRRTTGCNLYDPESLLTGFEIGAGLNYLNSARTWRNEEHYHLACSGALSIDQILTTAPRARRDAVVLALAPIETRHQEAA